MRKCGDCTLCCSVLEIKDDGLNKPSFCECGFLSPRGGCAVYEVRPRVCRGFMCEWLKGVFGDMARPDKSGIIMRGGAEIKARFGDKVVVFDECWQDASSAPIVHDMVKELTHLGVAVILVTFKHLQVLVYGTDEQKDRLEKLL